MPTETETFVFVQYIFVYDEELKAKLKTLQKRYNALNPRTENGRVRKTVSTRAEDK